MGSYRNYILPLLLFFPLTSILSGCREDSPKSYQGYVEGDFVYISSESLAKIKNILVERGQNVVAGQELVILDDEVEKNQHEIARKNMTSEISALNDLSKGQRSTELAVTAAQISQAKHDAEVAVSKLSRYQKLKESGYVSDFEIEQVKADKNLKQARVRELTAQLESQKLPSRIDKIDAQKAKAVASRLKLEQSQIELNKRLLRSVGAAEVFDVIYHEGEVVSPGTPIISLLPEDALKIRFFVHSTQLHNIEPGKHIKVMVPGGESPILARVKFISPKAEYTPPVIYSNAHNERMVFMVEAVPQHPEKKLRLGQSVEVEL